MFDAKALLEQLSGSPQRSATSATGAGAQGGGGSPTSSAKSQPPCSLQAARARVQGRAA